MLDLDQVLRFVVALIACVIAGGVLVNLYAAWCDIRSLPDPSATPQDQGGER